MKLYKMLAKEFIAEHAGGLRRARGLTQEEMAEQLHITSRAYGDLERGRYCFSAALLLFLLLMLSDRELAAFLGGFRERVRELERRGAA